MNNRNAFMLCAAMAATSAHAQDNGGIYETTSPSASISTSKVATGDIRTIFITASHWQGAQNGTVIVRSVPDQYKIRINIPVESIKTDERIEAGIPCDVLQKFTPTLSYAYSRLIWANYPAGGNISQIAHERANKVMAMNEAFQQARILCTGMSEPPSPNDSLPDTLPYPKMFKLPYSGNTSIEDSELDI